MNVPGFTLDALKLVNAMLFSEGDNPYLGKCGQKKLRAQNKKQRTPAQQQADQARAQANSGRNSIDPSTRSEAAKKGAKTRSGCSGQPSPDTSV